MKIKELLLKQLSTIRADIMIAIGILIGEKDIKTNASYIQDNEKQVIRISNTLKQELKLIGSNMTITEIEKELNHLCVDLNLLIDNIGFKEDSIYLEDIKL